MELINTSCNVVLTICAILALFKFVFKVEYAFKKPVLKELPVHKCIWEINKSRRVLNKLSEKVSNSLENLKYDNADLYFTKDTDTKLFKDLSGPTGSFEIKGDSMDEREKNILISTRSLQKEVKKNLRTWRLKYLKTLKVLKINDN